MANNKKRIEEDEAELALLLKPLQGDTENEEEQPKGDVKDTSEEKPKDEVLSKEEESYKKRYGDLRRHMQKKEEEWEARLKELEDRGKNTVAPPKSNEDLDQWISANPDVAGIVALLAKRQAEEILSETKAEVEQLSKLRKETSRSQKEAQILEKHPDFLKVREDDAFHDWAEEQPKWIQDSIYEEDAEPKAIIRALDLYKIDKGLTKEDKKRAEKDAATLVKTPRKPAVHEENDGMLFSESQIERMSAREYAEKEDQINAAIRNGRFLYDLSGAVR